jgi:hypothetical protein
VNAGSRFENARVGVEVLSNPLNPWCAPTYFDEDLMLFSPATKGDDLASVQPYGIAYLAGPLRLNPLTPQSVSAFPLSGLVSGARALPGRVLAAQAEMDRRDFMEAVARRDARWQIRSAGLRPPGGRLNLPGRLKLPGRP